MASHEHVWEAKPVVETYNYDADGKWDWGGRTRVVGYTYSCKVCHEPGYAVPADA